MGLCDTITSVGGPDFPRDFEAYGDFTEMLMSPDMKKVMMTERDNWQALPWGRNSLCLGETGLTILSQMTFLFDRQC